jgi:hypothetical protein
MVLIGPSLRFFPLCSFFFENNLKITASCFSENFKKFAFLLNLTKPGISGNSALYLLISGNQSASVPHKLKLIITQPRKSYYISNGRVITIYVLPVK